MAKKDDIEEAIGHYEVEQELKKAKRQNAIYRTICITAALSFFDAVRRLGSYAYDQWGPLNASVKLFIELVKRGGQ